MEVVGGWPRREVVRMGVRRRDGEKSLYFLSVIILRRNHVLDRA